MVSAFPRGGRKRKSSSEAVAGLTPQPATTVPEPQADPDDEDLFLSTPKELTGLTSGRKRPRADVKRGKDIYQLVHNGLRNGVQVLGVVKQVGAQYAVVNLANNLNGIVSKENVSDVPVDSVSLSDLLSVGMFIRCGVLSVGKSAEGLPRVDLSLKASVVNKGMTGEMFREGALVYGTVASVEDHGFIISFGVFNLTGFLSFKEAKCTSERPSLIVGQPVEAVVTKSKPILLTIDQQTVTTCTLKPDKKVTLQSIRPGCLVQVSPSHTLANGIKVKLLDYFVGSIPNLHLTDEVTAAGQSVEATLKTYPARVIYTDSEKHGIGLSLAPHVVNRDTSLVESLQPNQGKVYQDATVSRIETKRGIYLSLSNSLQAFVPIGKLAIGERKATTERFKVGEKVTCRCVDVAFLDKCLHASTVKSVIEADVLSYGDLKAGMPLNVEVLRVKDHGLIVRIGKNLKGLVPTIQTAEIQQTRKFKVGQKLKARVLSIKQNDEGYRVQLTLKRSLLRSKLSLFTEVDTIEVGATSHGFVSSIRAKQGLHVTFYNNVHGLVGLKDLRAFGVESVDESFKVGQVVRVKVVGKSDKGLRLSLRTQSVTADPKASALSLGQIVSGTVVRKEADNIIVRIQAVSKSNKSIKVDAVLPIHHLSDHLSMCKHLQQNEFNVGLVIPKLLVLDKMKNDATIIVSAKPLLIAEAEKKQLPVSLEQVKEDSMLVGYVARVCPLGVFVKFLNGLTALAPRANVADVWVSDPSQFFQIGQTVRAQAVHVDQALNKFIITLKQSIVQSVSPLFLSSLLTETATMDKQQHTIGSLCEGSVLQVKEYGVVVQLNTSKKLAFCMNEHLSKDAPKVGQDVKCRVLDASSEIYDVSLRRSLVNTRKGSVTEAAEEDLDESKEHQVVIELVKPMYAVVSIPELNNALAFAPLNDYNGKLLGLGAVQVGVKCKAKLLSRDTSRIIVRICEDQQMNKKRARSRSESVTTYENEDNVELEVGKVVRIQVQDIRGSSMRVSVLGLRRSKKLKGMVTEIHCTDVVDVVTEGDPSTSVFDSFNVGNIMDAKVVQVQKKSDRLFVNFSIKPSVLSGDDLPAVQDWSAVAASDAKWFQGFVEKKTPEGLIVSLSRKVKGLLFCTMLSSDLEYLDKVFNTSDELLYKPGVPIKVSKIVCDENTKQLDLGFVE